MKNKKSCATFKDMRDEIANAPPTGNPIKEIIQPGTNVKLCRHRVCYFGSLDSKTYTNFHVHKLIDAFLLLSCSSYEDKKREARFGTALNQPPNYYGQQQLA